MDNGMVCLREQMEIPGYKCSGVPTAYVLILPSRAYTKPVPRNRLFNPASFSLQMYVCIRKNIELEFYIKKYMSRFKVIKKIIATKLNLVILIIKITFSCQINNYF